MRKPSIRDSKISQVVDGKPYRIHYRKNGTAVEQEVCCDCLLVHLVEYKPTKSGLSVRVWRDDKKTIELRKRSKR